MSRMGLLRILERSEAGTCIDVESALGWSYSFSFPPFRLGGRNPFAWMGRSSRIRRG